VGKKRFLPSSYLGMITFYYLFLPNQILRHFCANFPDDEALLRVDHLVVADIQILKYADVP
jgi:hypothetical protein